MIVGVMQQCYMYVFTFTIQSSHSLSLSLLARDPDLNPTVYHPQWAYCAFAEIAEGGIDEGVHSANCTLSKTSNDTALRVNFNGNIRITDCHDCCMRWFLTINGSECVDPAPIEAVLYSINAERVNIHRGSTIAGICWATEDGVIGEGEYNVTLNVGMCDGFNETYNAYTGFNSLSTINMEEMPTRESFRLYTELETNVYACPVLIL